MQNAYSDADNSASQSEVADDAYVSYPSVGEASIASDAPYAYATAPPPYAQASAPSLSPMDNGNDPMRNGRRPGADDDDVASSSYRPHPFETMVAAPAALTDAHATALTVSVSDPRMAQEPAAVPGMQPASPVVP